MDRISLKLGLGIALLVLTGVIGGFVLVHRQHRRQTLETARANAVASTALIRATLEHQMLNKDRTLLRRAITELARHPNVQRVLVLDREGVVRLSSDPAIQSRHFQPSSPTCRSCHLHPAAKRARSTVLSLGGGRTLRVVEPIPNRPQCHGCHDAKQRMNGLIIADISIESSLSALERSVGQLAAGTAAVGVFMILGIGLLFRRLVIRRLVRFEATARAIKDGDLGRRVPVEGHDSFTRLERTFNEMADSTQTLLARVKAQRASLEKVMNSVDEGMVVLDRERRIVAANDGFRNRFHAAEGPLAGCSCHGPGLPPGRRCRIADRAPEGCPTVTCFELGQVQVSLCTRIRVDGVPRQEEVVASPVFGDDGEVAFVVEVWRDITERRSAEARLAETQRMVSLGMLASGFSHEMNTPLASIGACLDGLRALQQARAPADEAERAEAKELMEIAATQVERCGAITQQFLQLARGGTLGQEIVDLTDCARRILALVRRSAADHEVVVTLVENGKMPAVLADDGAVQQVLLNLLLNAIEASPAHARVQLRLAATPRITVTVADEGRGIAAEDLPHVFEPFFTRRQGGTGLGLFVSMNLVRSWGGDIEVESTPGRGTVFTVCFPSPHEESPDGATADPAAG